MNTNPPHVPLFTPSRGHSVGHLREVPPARDVLERPVEVPGDPVERAAQLLRTPGELLQLPPAMATDVAERGDGVWRRPDDQHRDAGDLVVDVVADLGDVFLAAGHLPHPLPHRLDLDAVELGRGVPRHRDPQLPVTHRCLPAVHIGHRPRVVVQQSLVQGSLGGCIEQHAHRSLAFSSGKSLGLPGTPAGSCGPANQPQS